jgi:hypothetical protein
LTAISESQNKMALPTGNPFVSKYLNDLSSSTLPLTLIFTVSDRKEGIVFNLHSFVKQLVLTD